MVQINPSAEAVHCSAQFAAWDYELTAKCPLTRWLGLDGTVWLSVVSMRLIFRAGCANVARSIYACVDVSSLPASLCLAVAGKC